MTQGMIRREIGIDYGHRVTNHETKCKNLHGHRGKVEAFCTGDLYEEGAQEGMVLDFGFLKEEMMTIIDRDCDHTMILWYKDPLLEEMLKDIDLIAWHDVSKAVEEYGFYNVIHPLWNKLYIIDCVPTAENLARHWFARLAPRVDARTNGRAKLAKVRLWETPNCWAEFPVRDI